MAFTYKRRRPSLLHNFWVYRRLVLLAMVLGVLLWFMLINSDPVTIVFPFRLGSLSGSLGIVILISALAGALVTALAMTILIALRYHRAGTHWEEDPAVLPDDRPPTDYAAKTPEGFHPSGWTPRDD